MEYLLSESPTVVAGEKITALLQCYNDVPVLLLVSGGSAWAVLAQIAPNVLTPKLTLGMVDERFSTDPSVNNFAQLAELPFFKTAVTAGVSSIDTRVQPEETLAAFTLRYETALRKWRAVNEDGVVLAILGMGADGHTAGIMPGYAAVFRDSAAFVVGYEVPAAVSLHTARVTVTPQFLEQAVTAAVAYVIGHEKHAQLKNVVEKVGNQNTCPALLWHQLTNLTIVTDCPL